MVESVERTFLFCNGNSHLVFERYKRCTEIVE